MKVESTPLPGVLLIEPRVHVDARGWFVETFQRDRYAAAGIAADFVQDNRSRSRAGALRGLHYQLRRPQGKLIEVTRGEVFDVAVDVRRGSPTFAQWFGATLSADDHRQLWIPPGYAHGFLALSEIVEVAYKCTAGYDPEDARAIRWDDPDLAIRWPLRGPPILSAADAAAPGLSAAALPVMRP